MFESPRAHHFPNKNSVFQGCRDSGKAVFVPLFVLLESVGQWKMNGPESPSRVFSDAQNEAGDGFNEGLWKFVPRPVPLLENPEFRQNIDRRFVKFESCTPHRRLPPWCPTQVYIDEITAGQFLHSLAVVAIIAMVFVWEVVNLFHQLFQVK